MTNTDRIVSDTGFRPMSPTDHAAAVLEATADLCDACEVRPAGHGHFALYCAACADLPYGAHA